MIVVVIIGCLAVMSIPVVIGYKRRAVITEAVAELNAVLLAQKIAHKINGQYDPMSGYLNSGNNCPERLDIGDLDDGMYFSKECYCGETYDSNQRFYVRCYIWKILNQAPKEDEAQKLLVKEGYIGVVRIDERGVIEVSSSMKPGTGYPVFE